MIPQHIADCAIRRLKLVSSKTMLRIGVLLALLICATNSGLADEPIVTLRLLDPRVVTNTDDTFFIAWGRHKTDVIAKRILTASEAKKLHELAEQELTDNENVPFCGHYPAYAITIENRGTKTVCGLCMTWAEKNRLRVLDGKKLLAFMETLLPLPDYFANLEQPQDVIVFAKNKEVPFYKLERKK